MYTNAVRALAAPAVLFLVSLASGCHGDIIDPQIEIPEKRSVVVVPFRDESFANGFDSPRGCELAERVTRALQKKAEFKVKPVSALLRIYEDHDLRNMTAREIAEKTKADYVVMGDVSRWRTQDDNVWSPNLLRGTSTIKVWVYETASAAKERTPDDPDNPPDGKGRYAVEKFVVNALYPQEFGMSNVGTTEKTVEQVEDGLMNASAVQVSWVLVEHTKDEEKLTSGK